VAPSDLYFNIGNLILPTAAGAADTAKDMAGAIRRQFGQE